MAKELNIYQRLHAVMKDVSYVQKEDKKVNNQYTFASHDGVTAAVRPALLTHGVLALPTNLKRTQDGNRTEVELDIKFVNVDKPDDFVLVPSVGYGIDPQDKGPGKAMSYAVKYALLKALSLETGDDPERENINHEKQEITRDHKIFQRDYFYELSKCKTEDAVKEHISIWNDDVEKQPEIIKGTIKDFTGNRILAIKNKATLAPTKFGFVDVAEALAFTKIMGQKLGLPPDELQQWAYEHSDQIAAVDESLKAEKYKENGKTPGQRFKEAYHTKIPQAAE